jgi:hypothetical protein
MENGDRSYKTGNTGHLVHLIGGGHEAVQKRNSGAGITERCSQQLAAVALPVVSNDQLLATAKWHCVVRNTAD